MDGRIVTCKLSETREINRGERRGSRRKRCVVGRKSSAGEGYEKWLWAVEKVLWRGLANGGGAGEGYGPGKSSRTPGRGWS